MLNHNHAKAGRLTVFALLSDGITIRQQWLAIAEDLKYILMLAMPIGQIQKLCHLVAVCQVRVAIYELVHVI